MLGRSNFGLFDTSKNGAFRIFNEKRVAMFWKSCTFALQTGHCFRMKRMLPIMIVFLMALLGCTGDAMKAEVIGAEGITVSYQGKNYSLATNQQGRRQEATLNDARSICRLCNIRPQRLLPTHGSKPGKNMVRLFARRRSYVSPLLFLHDGRRRLETAPFQSTTSRDYYVFALRHILC